MKHTEYATQMKSLQILLYDCSIPHILKRSIRPSKHPHIKMLMFCLKANKVDYEYFGPTESLVVHDVESDSEWVFLCDTLIQPTPSGLKVYVHITNEEYMYDTFNLIEECLDKLLPKKISYKFIGAK